MLDRGQGPLRSASHGEGAQFSEGEGLRLAPYLQCDPELEAPTPHGSACRSEKCPALWGCESLGGAQHPGGPTLETGVSLPLQRLPTGDIPSLTVHVLILRWRSRPPGRKKSCLLELRPAWDKEGQGDGTGRVVRSGPAIVPCHGSPKAERFRAGAAGAPGAEGPSAQVCTHTRAHSPRAHSPTGRGAPWRWGAPGGRRSARFSAGSARRPWRSLQGQSQGLAQGGQ